MNELLNLVLNPIINIFNTVATMVAVSGWTSIIVSGVLLFGAVTLLEVVFAFGVQAVRALFPRKRA